MSGEKYLHNVTDANLANMLERECQPYNSLAIIDVEVVKEAARRLRNIQRILDAKVPFNSEQFNV